MVQIELVTKINKNLARLHDEATRNRENPLVIELLDNLVQLTNVTDVAPAPPKGTAPITGIEGSN